MTWLWSIPAVLLPCCAAQRLVSAGMGEEPGGRSAQGLRLCLAAGLGLGLSSCSWFLWLVLFGTPHAMYRLADATLWLLVAFLFRPAAARDASESEFLLRKQTHAGAVRSRSPLTIAVACLFALCLASAATGFIGEVRTRPDGGWDAWAIWNLRAKFLAGENWREALSPGFDHSDYPLLIPATLARWRSFAAGAAFARADDLKIHSALLAFLFTGLTIALCTLAVSGRRGGSSGLLAGMVLLGTVRLLRCGAAQYADVPLAFFFLATATLFVLHDSRPDSTNRACGRGLLLLAGLAAALCAWTKNEGLLFVCVVFVLRALLVWFRRGLRSSIHEGCVVLAGAAPVLAVVLVFKIQAPAGNDLLAAQHDGATWSRLLDAGRHALVLRSLAATVLQVVHGFAAVLPVCFLLLGRRRAGAGEWLFPALAGCLILSGYYATYLVTPYELGWHLSTSADRLIVQLWPLAVLAIFLAMRSPEEALAAGGEFVSQPPASDAPAELEARARAA